MQNAAANVDVFFVDFETVEFADRVRAVTGGESRVADAKEWIHHNGVLFSVKPDALHRQLRGESSWVWAGLCGGRNLCEICAGAQGRFDAFCGKGFPDSIHRWRRYRVLQILVPIPSFSTEPIFTGRSRTADLSLCGRSFPYPPFSMAPTLQRQDVTASTLGQ